MPDALTVYQLHGFEYDKQTSTQFPALKLGLKLWDGVFEGKESTWLRWIDEHDEIIPTGRERAEEERQRAQHEHKRAEQERERAERERERAEQAEQGEAAQRQRAEQTEQLLKQEQERLARLAGLLRELGRDPDRI